ncbi:MAG: DUF1566 domain-containing protein [Bacteroidales bacterium]|nr:DUF1566 domain-containing protein [Bacteroidales bacterium]
MKHFLLILCILCTLGLRAQPQQKSVAIFNSLGKDIDENIGNTVRNALQTGIQKMGYEVFEREELETAQKEFDFQTEANELYEIAAGKEADYSCFASITRFGRNYQITCKMVELIKSSYKIVFIESLRTKNGEDDLGDIIEKIAEAMFSGGSGIATVSCKDMGICKDSDKCKISIRDEQKLVTWEEAIKICESKGDGWYLPDKDELQAIYKNKKFIEDEVGKKFQSSDYWSSSKRNNYESFSVSFKNGDILHYSNKEKNRCRCIKKDE